MLRCNFRCWWCYQTLLARVWDVCWVGRYVGLVAEVPGLHRSLSCLVDGAGDCKLSSRLCALCRGRRLHRFFGFGAVASDRTTPRKGLLAAVVGGGFGMDEEARNLRTVQFEGVFKLGDDLVDA